MGHNLSDRKLRSMEAQADSDARKGWRELHGRWEAVQTPAGVLARGGELKAFCRKREDCFRKATFDARWWVDHGLGTIPLEEALSTYRCGLVRCRMGWEMERYPRGTPLGRYLGEPGARVRVVCGICKTEGREFKVKRFIELIERAGTGSAGTPADQLSGALIRGACPGCGVRHWSVTFSTASAGG